jgi:hypothetical protein
MTHLEDLDRLPPNICRIMAKRKDRAGCFTDVELARRSGWSRGKVARLSLASTWAGHADDVDQWMEACGLKWSERHQYRTLIKSALGRGGVDRMRHLAKSKKNGQTAKLIKRIARSYVN